MRVLDQVNRGEHLPPHVDPPVGVLATAQASDMDSSDRYIAGYVLYIHSDICIYITNQHTYQQQPPQHHRRLQEAHARAASVALMEFLDALPEPLLG
jgi:hypothetical protein